MFVSIGFRLRAGYCRCKSRRLRKTGFIKEAFRHISLFPRSKEHRLIHIHNKTVTHLLRNPPDNELLRVPSADGGESPTEKLPET